MHYKFCHPIFPIISKANKKTNINLPKYPQILNLKINLHIDEL